MGSPQRDVADQGWLLSAREWALGSALRREQDDGGHAKYCRAHGDRLHRAMVRHLATFTIESFDANGNRREEGGDPLVVAVRGKSVARTRIMDNLDGTCESTA